MQTPAINEPAGTPPAPAGRRRPHKKSRAGCSECRRRRVKCGEEKPICQSCVRQGSQCVYRDVARPLSNSGRTNSSPGSEPSLAHAGPSPHIEPPAASRGFTPVTPGSGRTLAVAAFEMDDLLLLHHWSVSASRDIVRSSEIDYYWQTVFPRIGFQYPFVMHGILSLAALHIAHIDSASRKRRTIDASRHHNTSLQGFQQAIGEMSDDNSDALFACSILNIIYILAMLRPVNGESNGGIGSRSRNTRALGTEWIPIIRGVEAVIHPVFDRVRKGPLSPMTNLGNWAELDLASQTAPDDEVFCRIRAAWLGMPDSEVYDEALLVLRKCHLYITQFEAMAEESLHAWGYNRGWSGPLMFLHFASEDYFTRLHQRQPPALIIFSYFGALLHGLNDYWFMEGWGKDVVRVTDEVLGEYWESWLEWPKRRVGLGHGT